MFLSILIYAKHHITFINELILSLNRYNGHIKGHFVHFKFIVKFTGEIN